MGQQPQLHPQDDLPRFLSLRSRMMIPATSPISAILTMTVPAFSPIH